MTEKIISNENVSKLSMTRAVLVGVVTRDTDETEVEVSLDELERLLDTAGGISFARMVQNRETPDVSTYIGSGKTLELRDLCRSNDIPLCVFDCELSPSQIKNIEDELDGGGGIRVIDRTMLILDIFALHAVTSEGKLQVELAQLRYTAPRLIGKGLALSRQQGGNIAMRGPGETKLETDRRHLKRRIAALETQLAELEKNRTVQRSARERSGIFTVSIAGYTNAGKSTLLNYLTGAGILAEDKLFATLDPTTRRFTLPGGEEILLTDTVGFIRNLPHHLINAFKSTLDEVRYSDAVIVVIDASDPENQTQLEVTKGLLEELYASEKPILYVYNKCDLGSERVINVVWGASKENVARISAKTGEGVGELVEKLEAIVRGGKTEETYVIPNSEAGAVSQLYAAAAVKSVEYGPENVTVIAVSDAKAKGMFAKYLQKV